MTRDRKENSPARALALGLFGIALLNLLAATFDNIWYAVGINHVIMLPLALWTLGDARREWLRLNARVLLLGAFWGGFLLAGTFATLLFLRWLDPALYATAMAPMSMKDKVPAWLAISLLLIPIIPGEEIVWRGAVMLPLVQRWGSVAGVSVAAIMFTCAHLMLGSGSLLFAAMVLGVFWGIVTLFTRSLLAAVLCHLIWDLVMLFFWPNL